MRQRQRWIVGAAAAVLGVGGAAGSLAPALGGSAAAAVSSYKVSASGTGMQLTLAGHTLVAAASTVSAGSGSPVVGAGSGELSPAHVADERATAAAPGTSQTRAQVCTAHPTSSFPAPFSTAVVLDAACGAASASEASTGRPAASGTGSVATLSIGPPSSGTTPAGALRTLLPTPVTPGSALATALGKVLGPLPSLPQSGLPLATVVQQTASSATGSTVTALIDATLGPATSTIATGDGTLSAQSADTGATVGLLEGAGAGGGPLLTVDVGRADTTARVDTASGHVTESATAASVTVTLAPPVGTRQTVSLTPGMSKSFLTGTPLQTTITVSTPSTTATSGSAKAAGVSVDLAQGTGAIPGGVVLVLGASSAQASATAPTTTAASTPQSPQSAASTGSAGAAPVLTGATTVHTGEPWSGPLPIALLTLSLVAGLGLLARRHLFVMGHLLGRAAARLVHPRGR